MGTYQMSVEELKAIVKRNNDEFWNKGDMSVADEVLATDYVRYMPGGVEILGLEGIKQEVTTVRKAFPDIQFTIEDMIAEGDKVAARFIGHGTHKGDFRGIAGYRQAGDTVWHHHLPHRCRQDRGGLGGSEHAGFVTATRCDPTDGRGRGVIPLAYFSPEVGKKHVNAGCRGMTQ
jgi:predicted ester cyclase